jgi:hypothetical protein
MPAYVSSPFGIRNTLLPGVNAYSYGGFDDHNPGTKIRVTSYAVTSDVATIIGQIVEGQSGILPGSVAPVAGELISTQGLPVDATNAAITTISITSAGIATITYPLTAANQAAETVAAIALIPAQETADPLVTGSGKQFAMQAFQGLASNSRDVSWVVSTPSAPSSFTAALQIADVDEDPEYTTIDTSTASGVRIVIGVRANFIRIKVTAVSGGTSPTIIGKILE